MHVLVGVEDLDTDSTTKQWSHCATRAREGGREGGREEGGEGRGGEGGEGRGGREVGGVMEGGREGREGGE